TRVMEREELPIAEGGRTGPGATADGFERAVAAKRRVAIKTSEASGSMGDAARLRDRPQGGFGGAVFAEFGLGEVVGDDARDGSVDICGIDGRRDERIQVEDIAGVRRNRGPQTRCGAVGGINGRDN